MVLFDSNLYLDSALMASSATCQVSSEPLYSKLPDVNAKEMLHEFSCSLFYNSTLAWVFMMIVLSSIYNRESELITKQETWESSWKMLPSIDLLKRASQG